MDRGRGKSINNKPKNTQQPHLFLSMQFGEKKRGVHIGRINASRDDGSSEYLHSCMCWTKKVMDIYKYIWKSDTFFIFWKIKVHPRTGHEGPEVEQTYRSTLSLTSALDLGGQRHAPVALPTEETRYPLYRRLGESQGRNGWMLKISPPPPPGFDPWTVQYIASHYTDWAIPAHSFWKVTVTFRKLLPLQRVWLTAYNPICVEGQLTVFMTTAQTSGHREGIRTRNLPNTTSPNLKCDLPLSQH